MTVGLYLGLLDILSENKEANKIHIHTCCIKASHSETIPGLCFEIMAEGGSKVGKESPVSFKHYCSHSVLFFNRFQSYSVVCFYYYYFKKYFQ